MFVSPIVYPVSLVPDQWRLLYSLNPMVGMIEGFRWALLGKDAPDLVMMAGSYLVLLGVLVAGTIYFRQMDQQFADVI